MKPSVTTSTEIKALVYSCQNAFCDAPWEWFGMKISLKALHYWFQKGVEFSRILEPKITRSCVAGSTWRNFCLQGRKLTMKSELLWLKLCRAMFRALLWRYFSQALIQNVIRGSNADSWDRPMPKEMLLTITQMMLLILVDFGSLVPLSLWVHSAMSTISRPASLTETHEDWISLRVQPNGASYVFCCSDQKICKGPRSGVVFYRPISTVGNRLGMRGFSPAAHWSFVLEASVSVIASSSF